MIRTLSCLLLTVGFSVFVHAEEWPIFRGQGQDATVSKAAWDASLGRGRPKVLWQEKIGPGYSSMTVVDGRLYTMGSQGDEHIVLCLNALTGTVVWRQSYKAAKDVGGYAGARATPTVADGRVYTVSNQGQIHCWAADDGKLIWERSEGEIRKLLKTQWGASGSVLVTDGVAVINGGDHGLGLDPATGRTIWSSDSGTAGYATPMACMNGKAAAIFSAAGLSIVRAKDGKASRIYPWETKYNVNAADPILFRNYILISSNYGHGSALLQVEGNRFSKVWENTKMRSWFPTPVLVGNRVIGNDQGSLVCLEILTGNEVWRGPKIGIGGTVTVVGDTLVVLTERGELQVSDANAGRYEPSATAQLGGGQWWTSPVFIDGLLFVRSSKPGELSCLDLRVGQ